MKRFVIVVAAYVALACSDSTGPHALTVGVYAYTSTVPFLKSDGSLGTSHFAGTLTLNYVAADSIAGTWNITETAFSSRAINGPATLGFWNKDAYVLYARLTPGFDTIGHRIRPDLGCVVRYIPSGVEGTCTLTKQ